MPSIALMIVILGMHSIAWGLTLAYAGFQLQNPCGSDIWFLCGTPADMPMQSFQEFRTIFERGDLTFIIGNVVGEGWGVITDIFMGVLLMLSFDYAIISYGWGYADLVGFVIRGVLTVIEGLLAAYAVLAFFGRR